MRRTPWQECLSYAVYYAPRGQQRLLLLGETIAQRYLEPTYQLVGVIGEPGTGKSSLIRGMFPGLELTNDDAGINVRPTPLLQMAREGRFTAQTFHLDARFELAFSQAFEVVEAVRAALRDGRRVVVENFEAVYPALGINAQILAGVGEEIVVVRPDLFGPFPDDLLRAVEGTAIFRRMAHTAEDLTAFVLERDFGYPHPQIHSDIPRGFVMEFEQAPPGVRLDELEARVRNLIGRALPISYADEDHIAIGPHPFPCTGPRIHLSNTAEIENFRIVPEFIYDELHDTYCLVGFVGEPQPKHFLGRHLPVHSS